MKRKVHRLPGLLLALLLLSGWRTCFAQHGESGYVDARMARAGFAQRIAPWARYSSSRKYCAYYVGGGANYFRLSPDPRYLHEGTWGVDYAPWPRRHVRLDWWHGRHYQDGGGHYEPDHHNNPFHSFFRSGPFASDE